jgi:hypothetical protein
MTSNAESEKRGELAGRTDGRCWAEHTTEHDDLRRVAAIEFQPGLDCYKALCDARLYLLLKKKMSGQERTTRIHSRNPSAPG